MGSQSILLAKYATLALAAAITTVPHRAHAGVVFTRFAAILAGQLDARQAQVAADPATFIPLLTMWGLGGFLAVSNAVAFYVYVTKTVPAERAAHQLAIETQCIAHREAMKEQLTACLIELGSARVEFLKALREERSINSRRHRNKLAELRELRTKLDTLIERLGGMPAM